jgi:putative two-component system response regulator
VNSPRILVVDDDPQGRQLLQRALSPLGEVDSACDGQEALDKIAVQAPDLLLLDVMMPRLNGLQVCSLVKADPRTRLIPVVILTSLDQMPDKIRALELDADDYLTKPYNLTELITRSRSLLRLKHYTDELESASGVLKAVAEIVERRDQYTGHHCREVAALAVKVGVNMGLPEEKLAILRLGAAFHDIGKIGVPDAVLHKPGALDPEELEAMRRHPVIGSELLEPMRTLKGIVPLVRHHHEKLDGSGYPDGLKGEQISLEVRILTVVDIYAALSARRSYKPALPAEKSIGILRAEAAKGWWDAAVVESLAALVLE